MFIRDYIPQCHVVEEYNLCSFTPMSMHTYVFLRYVPRFPKVHKLCSLTINICSSIFNEEQVGAESLKLYKE
jgi:hypothetical protein